MEDLTMKLGLVMEAAPAQQGMAANVLERLREHTAGLDSVVREEIRTTLIEELQALEDESRRTAAALQALQRTVGRRALLGGVAALLLGALPLGGAWWLLPSRGELEVLRATRAELAANIAQLSERGGRVQLRRCGAQQRLCVRIDRAAPRFGQAADYLVVQGY
ncbi:MAG TPA: hypothetical protein VET66_14500 [Steroidobacteraceae bacterium]|nr:hypothetical protein [Steroidobacteraceae bacterium]